MKESKKQYSLLVEYTALELEHTQAGLLLAVWPYVRSVTFEYQFPYLEKCDD